MAAIGIEPRLNLEAREQKDGERTKYLVDHCLKSNQFFLHTLNSTDIKDSPHTIVICLNIQCFIL